MTTLSYREINDDVLGPLRPPSTLYYFVVMFLSLGIGWGAFCWMYQVKTGMGVAGINHPVGWGAYICNFVFWVGIAHSGTLISAILYLVRSRWRTAVSRSSEAMTIFAVMTAGLFPLVHLGRVWVFYFILPYPSQRQLWPNFISPLVWDVVAVSTYFTVSSIFFYVGLIPDVAAARDRSVEVLGTNHPRSQLYRILALGWSGSGNQWRHHGRGYLFFAALATPLVISVHSVVSWDFAMGLLPGWHATIFAPYFVAGAIHSGLAMVLTLLIPMRRIFRLEKLITVDHFEAVAKTMLVTTLIVGYAYVIEPFIAWYSGDIFEQQFSLWRMTGWIAWLYWILPLLNVLIPLTFVFRRVRRNLVALFAVSIFVNIGMWLERLFIVIGSTAHDFLPHNWDSYFPSWVEISITAGSFAFFFFWFFVFSKVLPTIPLSDVKEDIQKRKEKRPDDELQGRQVSSVRESRHGVVAVYAKPAELPEAVRKMREASFHHIETYSPMRLLNTEPAMGRGRSPVRFWTLVGALSGMIGGFSLAILSAKVNGLIVGGKHPVSIIPYCVVGFEGTILLGTIANFIGLIVHSHMGSPKVPPWYLTEFTRDRFGLFVSCDADSFESVKSLLSSTGAEDVRVIE